MNQQPGNPLHGITLEAILTQLVEHYGWVEMAKRIDVNCFKTNPSIRSSLTFLRRTPWARKKVEDLYLRRDRAIQRRARRTAHPPAAGGAAES